jgi:hypothetical protein
MSMFSQSSRMGWSALVTQDTPTPDG